jgi:hypothetical protein
VVTVRGSVYPTRDGRWRAAVVLADGRRKYLSAATREDVAKKLRLLQRLTDDRLPVNTDGVHRRWSVDGALADHIAAARVRPSTLEGYRSRVRTRIVPTLGHFRLDSLHPEHVEAWCDAMLADGLAPTSVLQMPAGALARLGNCSAHCSGCGGDPGIAVVEHA